MTYPSLRNSSKVCRTKSPLVTTESTTSSPANMWFNSSDTVSDLQQANDISLSTAITNDCLCICFHCNLLLFGISDSLLQHLQAVQNTAACLVTNTGWREHITPVLRQLCWLTMTVYWYKLAILVYKALDGLSPQYTPGQWPLACRYDRPLTTPIVELRYVQDFNNLLKCGWSIFRELRT